MKTLEPELSALIIIFRSTGPVISTRRSLQVRGRRRDQPVALADLPGLGQEVRTRAAVELALPHRPALQQLAPPWAELALEQLDEGERLGGQDLGVGGSDDLCGRRQDRTFDLRAIR